MYIYVHIENVSQTEIQRKMMCEYKNIIDMKRRRHIKKILSLGPEGILKTAWKIKTEMSRHDIAVFFL